MQSPALHTEKRAKLVLASVIFATAPMPVFYIFCVGLLPPGVQIAMTLRLLNEGDYSFALVTGINVLIGCALSYSIAHIFSRGVTLENNKQDIIVLSVECVIVL